VTPDVRIAAAEAIGEATSKMSAAELAEATRVLEPLASGNDPGMRRAAVGALVKMGTQEAAEIALRQLDDPDPFVRTVARDAARKSSTVELRKNLENPSPAIRVQTIRLLGQKPPEETAEALLRKLSDPNSAVRLAAVEVLSRYDFRHYADGAEQLLLSPDPNIRAAAAALLGNACDRGGGRALLRQFAAQAHPEIVRNLGQCSGADESDVVFKASDAKSDVLRRAAVEAMSSNLRRPGFEARLKRMSSEDSVPEIRLAAVEALSPKASSSPWEIVEEPPVTLTIVHATPGRRSVEAVDVAARTGYNIQDYRWVTTSSSKSFKDLKFRISDDKSRLQLSATFDPALAQEAALASVSGRLVLFLAPKEPK
jgi:HEAT repeat protein